MREGNKKMTKEKYGVKEDVKPSLTSSAYVKAPFDVAKKELERKGYRIISLEEAAKLGRDKDSIHNEYANNHGNYHFVREGILYVPEKGIYITKNSPIMDFPEEATQAHKEEKDFYLTDEQVRKALEDSLWIPSKSELRIPTAGIKLGERGEIKILDNLSEHGKIELSPFEDSVLANYIFGEETKKYGDFLRSKNLGCFSVVNGKVSLSDERPFIMPLIYNPFNEVTNNPMDFDGGEPNFFLNGNNEFAKHIKDEFPEDTFIPEYFPVRGIKEVD